jgi:Carboxypeptidase regulatory-like domain/TonB dependent receptor-like, beta-barrel/TonB-dependent Receptor Plug Domain
MKTPRIKRTLVAALLSLISTVYLSGIAGAQPAAGQTGTLRGAVATAAPDGQSYNVPGASLKLKSPAQALDAVTDDAGEYKFQGLLPGVYTLEASVQGFKTASKSITIRAGEIAVENISLELAEVTATVTVTSSTSIGGVQTNETAPATTIKQSDLQTLPLTNEQLLDALPLVPGVVRGPDGLINMNGARASQSAMTVNSANVTDPVTGDFAINLPIEAVESAQVLTNPYAAEYGKFTGGLTAVETRSGTDKFNVEAQSFFPRFARRDGKWTGVEAFTPRLAFSGPIKRNKLWFMQSFEYRFVRTPIESLPPDKRDTRLESFDSVSQLDWEINPSNHLTSTFSLFPEKLGYVGLNTFNPEEVTPNYKQRGFFWALNERRTMSTKAVLESYFSIKKFDADVFPSSGEQAMNFTPDVNTGNFYNRQDRRSTRIDALEVYNFEPPKFAGAHFMKVGIGLTHTTFEGRNTSNTVRVLRQDGTRAQQIDFLGQGTLSRNTTEFNAFFQDKWTINDRLTLEYGVRMDRDNIASTNNVAPRLSFAFAPVRDGRTVIRGGVGLFYDQIDLNVATFPQMQERLITLYGADGRQVLGTQLQRMALQNGEYLTPRSVNWNIEVDREWLKNLFVRVGYQQRQGTREYILDPINSSTSAGILSLSNAGKSRYRDLQVTARYTFRHDELNASYVRSRAFGDLNDFNSYFGNFQNPIIRPNERSLLPYDAPNRFVFWGNFGVKYGITVAPVLDLRNGFPLSNIDENRDFVGERNRAGRYPTFASLDMQVMKSLSAPGRFKEKYRFRVGVKVFNLTNHFNPRDYQGNLASNDFGGFYNGVGRKYGMKFLIEKK